MIITESPVAWPQNGLAEGKEIETLVLWEPVGNGLTFSGRGWPQIFDFSKNPSLQDQATLSCLQAFALTLSFELRALYLSPRLFLEGFLPLRKVLLPLRCRLLVSKPLASPSSLIFLVLDGLLLKDGLCPVFQLVLIYKTGTVC